MATLAGLTADDPQWQTDLPADADTSVDAVVSVYGLYDWHDRSTRSATASWSSSSAWW